MRERQLAAIDYGRDHNTGIPERRQNMQTGDTVCGRRCRSFFRTEVWQYKLSNLQLIESAYLLETGQSKHVTGGNPTNILQLVEFTADRCICYWLQSAM